MMVTGNDQFIVKVPNTAGPLGLEIGADLFVAWNTDDCRALDYRTKV
jgi:putative spermidine/putrescine transport system ATP-binding protein